jgi:hypothetical protein
MVSNSQLKRVPGVQKAHQFARDKLHPGGYEHWLRVVMNQETARLVGGLDFKHASALEISGVQWKDFGFARYKSVGYPDFDICAGVLDEKFDIILGAGFRACALALSRSTQCIPDAQSRRRLPDYDAISGQDPRPSDRLFGLDGARNATSARGGRIRYGSNHHGVLG